MVDFVRCRKTRLESMTERRQAPHAGKPAATFVFPYPYPDRCLVHAAERLGAERLGACVAPVPADADERNHTGLLALPPPRRYLPAASWEEDLMPLRGLAQLLLLFPGSRAKRGWAVGAIAGGAIAAGLYSHACAPRTVRVGASATRERLGPRARGAVGGLALDRASGRHARGHGQGPPSWLERSVSKIRDVCAGRRACCCRLPLRFRSTIRRDGERVCGRRPHHRHH